MQFDPELDTNGNGYIDLQDDPFTPYFPGPEYVDWVAVSYYHYGVEYPWKENYLPESPTKFRDGLDGRMGTNPARFYTMFAERYNLPMAVMETGAAFFVDSDPGPGRLEMSRAWWRQVYGRSLYKELPLLRAIEWFEHFHADEGTDRDCEFGGLGEGLERVVDVDFSFFLSFCRPRHEGSRDCQGAFGGFAVGDDQ